MASLDSKIFKEWAHHFVLETALFRKQHKHLLLVLDGFDAHVEYDALKALYDANIVIVALPAHTSHALLPLDVGVFSTLKERFKNIWERGPFLQKET